MLMRIRRQLSCRVINVEWETIFGYVWIYSIWKNRSKQSYRHLYQNM